MTIYNFSFVGFFIFKSKTEVVITGRCAKNGWV